MHSTIQQKARVDMVVQVNLEGDYLLEEET